MTDCSERGRALALAAAAALFATAGCAGEGGPEPREAPAFSLEGLAGEKVALEDYRGKVVLLDFWATYCLPCHDSIPAFQRLHDEYRENGFEVVGISIDAFVENVPGFVKELGMRYTVALDAEGRVKDAYGVRGLPATYLIDRTGRIAGSWTGYDGVIGAEISAAVQKILQDP